MCGIFCAFCFSDCPAKLSDIYDTCKCYIVSRGPDFNSTKIFEHKHCKLFFAASVLWLQGTGLTEQPIENNCSIFVYNGDVFGGTLISDDDRLTTGDTRNLLKCLETNESILDTLLAVSGPYAFIYLDKRTMKLYFARDKYGRRSLIIGKNLDTILLMSVFSKHSEFECVELPSLGVFCFDLITKGVTLYPWYFTHSNFSTKLNDITNVLNTKIIVKDRTSVVQHPFVEPLEIELCSYKNFDGSDVFQSLLHCKTWLNKVEKLQNLLEIAIQKRIGTQPPFCQNCINQRITCCHSTTGILFSGGIDCAILALLADKFVDRRRPIELLNVAFNADAPDRITAYKTLQELKKLCPERNWNFIKVDVKSEELQTLRSRHIKHLIYPLNSILDDSLGCALWFASRGISDTYKSPCRVLLVGMGADELFGGYTKHRAALKRGGWSELNRLLEDDWQNISHRNLARDDRVVADHGRQLRTPYLDEEVVEYVRGLKCWERTYPAQNLPQGVGEKILLRSLGYHLGLVEAATFKKRALQFGSRIANSKENAKDISPRL